MRIRTVEGPPLPAEIAEQAARAIALTAVLFGSDGGAIAEGHRRDTFKAQGAFA